MSTWRRRIRGAIGMGMSWGLAWLAAGVILLLIVGPGAADVPFPLFFGLLGFLAGATFSVLLGLVESRRRFDHMSIPRFAWWGAVGGFLFGVMFVLVAAVAGDTALPILEMGTVFTLAGAASAAGSLVVARMADDRSSLGPGADVFGPGLIEEEERERVGGGG